MTCRMQLDWSPKALENKALALKCNMLEICKTCIWFITRKLLGNANSLPTPSDFYYLDTKFGATLCRIYRNPGNETEVTDGLEKFIHMTMPVRNLRLMTSDQKASKDLHLHGARQWLSRDNWVLVGVGALPCFPWELCLEASPTLKSCQSCTLGYVLHLPSHLYWQTMSSCLLLQGANTPKFL